ncbi:stalled ribosome sensor GCN1-like [Tubulanus polymorphus]|uniref:stalled ribosome sensor GCN1-like n=1 Tax=Tubulanus polymorphus TaxID=672921 RepID=UPI003DA3CFA0
MADSTVEIMEALKSFNKNVTTSKVTTRCQIVNDLLPHVVKNEFPETAVKGLSKLLVFALQRYRDAKSRRAVEDLIKALAKNHWKVFLKQMGLVLVDYADKNKKLPTCRWNSGACLQALNWSFIAVNEALKNGDMSDGVEFKRMVEAQCLLVLGSMAFNCSPINNTAYRKMFAIWRERKNSLAHYHSFLLSSEPNISYLPMCYCIMKYLNLVKDSESISKYKPTYVEIFTRTVLGAKSKPQNHILANCKHLLRHLNHDDFKKIILPAVQKAMLRNPEIVVESLQSLISSVSIDLSQYSLEIGKNLATQVHAKDEGVCSEAMIATKCLAEQCSDPGAIENLVSHYFAVLNGADGKLTLTAHRQNMVTAIGNLSYNAVTSQGIQTLSVAVAEMFIPYLKLEVHEGTLVHCLSMLSLWCAKFSTSVPPKLIEWLKTGIGLKVSTSAVRNAYLQCMNSAFHGDTLQQAAEVLPILIQTVEKACNQSSQIQLVSEAISASYLIIRLSLVDVQAESKLTSFWNILFNKRIFLNNKFLIAASNDALIILASIVERLIMDFPQKMNETSSGPFYATMLHCLIHPAFKVRQHAQMCLKKVLSILGGAKISLALLKQYKVTLDAEEESARSIVPSSSVEISSGEGLVEKPRNARLFADAMVQISNVKDPEMRDAKDLGIATLILSHHELIVQTNIDCWTEIMASLKLDAGAFIRAKKDEILQLITEIKPVTKSVENTLKTLCRIEPNSILPGIVQHVQPVLRSTSSVNVRVEEYEIMKTPDGVLYNTSVINSVTQEVDDKNVKRESKLYSYEDQLADLEYKKEMERKKKGNKGEVKLTKKQEELKQEQLKKEKEIRDRLKSCDMKLSDVCAILSACLAGNAEQFGIYMPELLGDIMPLFKSPLAAPRVRDLYLDMKRAVFGEEYKVLGCLLSNVTLRLMKPQCQLDQWWTQEPLKLQTVKTMKLLHEKTSKSPFSAAAFAYCFYLIRAVLKDNGAVVGGSIEVQKLAIEVVRVHAQIRCSDPEDVLHGAELLPRRDMLEMLVSILNSSSSKVQQVAQAALFAVAECGSGMDGCAAAEQNEIDILLRALKSPRTATRESALLALNIMIVLLPTPTDDPKNGFIVAQRILVAKCDPEENVQKPADKLWEDMGLDLLPEMCCGLVDDLVYHEEVIRKAASEALALCLEEFSDQTSNVLEIIMEKYEKKLYRPPPVLDNFGRKVSEQGPDEWAARSGLALALGKMSPSVPEDQIERVFHFFVSKGLLDRNDRVRKHMLDAAVAALDKHGKQNVGILLPVFEIFLQEAPDSASYDSVRQSVVVLMGSLARHLDKDDPKVKPIVGKLIDTLSTPSQQVQEAVANCLPPLVPAIKSDAPELVRQLMNILLETEKYGERRGAAYGLAGLVKGLGILSLKQLNIMSTLQEAIQNKKNPVLREGALFAFEMLCIMLGKLFEPYVVHILPHLLLCFGDSNRHVRSASDDTAKAVMSKLSAHGVKLVLPALLTALEEDSWRTKTGSVELLGAMAFCAPKQLSACLPSIVPKLTEVLTDSHMKVQKAGAQALKQIGAVIKNPEIQEIVPVLLAALQEPTKKTTACLVALLETKFVHFIDAPSLALIMPVVQRAFQDRSTETRKMAAQIIGNMYSLTDQKDLAPYLPTVIPGLKSSLLDPVPEVRGVSSRALGAIVRGMGESSFEDLLPWLMQTLTSEQSSVDRSGAAQGLAEVVGGLGIEKLHKLMPDIIQTSERSDIASHVRDGYIMMYIYLPGVFGNDFTPYVGPILPSILQALADESEYVRDTALRAGQRIINMYADTAVTLLLPELEHGLFDENWRIRYSSVQLLGDLLYRVSGVTGKMTTEGAGEDDNFGTEGSQSAILMVLGEDRRNRVLAGLYMGRSDTALMVRQAALHVWKVIVTNTPKTLREILPTLFSLLLGCLASTSYDKRQVAARTLGDIVRKLGERVLPEIIPILERGLDSEQSDQRQGVCIGLTEIMSSTSRDHVVVFADSLVPTVRKALLDPLPEVREAAAKTFDNLHNNIGSRALDDILPYLLKSLDDPELSDLALDGLKQVMAVKSRVVLPFLVPQLTAPPVNSRALSFLSTVAGESLTKHLNRILPALMRALAGSLGCPDEVEQLGYCQSVVLSVQDPVGIHSIMDELLGATSNATDMSECFAAITMLKAFCSQTKMDYEEYVPQLIRGLISLFTYTDTRVLLEGWECLNAITKNMDPTEMLQHISTVRQALRFALSDYKEEELPGFCIPKKGIAPILPIFREGILNGPPELKESAAIGLGEVIKRTSAEALKPSVIHITGPLIRILGDRFSFSVKVAVLETLGLLLSKCGVMLKPFLPQLQTTFIKALNDPNRSVRLKAASALGQLISIHTRVDPLFTELHTGIKNADDASIRDTFLQALRGCITGAGNKMSNGIRQQIVTALIGLMSSGEDTARSCSAGCLGAICCCLPDEEFVGLLIDHLLDNDPSLDWTIRHGRSLALMVALKECPQNLLDPNWEPKVTSIVCKYMQSDRVPVVLSGIRCAGYILRYQWNVGNSMAIDLISSISKCSKNDSNDVKALAAQVINFVACTMDKPLPAPTAKAWIPMLVNGTKEKNTLVKSNSELALVAILHLSNNDKTLQMYADLLDNWVKDPLMDLVSRVLRKISNPEIVADIDDTILR